MRVVDDHRERLPLVDGFEAPWDAAHGLDADRNRVVLDPELPCGEERAERVLDVEAAAQLDVDPSKRIGVVDAEGDGVGKARGQSPPVFVADVDDRGNAVREQPPLRLEVRLHVAVEVEVVLAQVREDEHGESHPVEPVQLRRVRRRLHRARPVARVEHLAERPLQVDRLRGRALDAAPLSADARLDRAQQAGTAPGGGEDRVQEERRRRLAARAGDARHLEVLGRAPEELVGGHGHRRACVWNDDLRDGDRQRPLDDERHGSVLHRLRREIVPIGSGARDTEEDGAGPCVPRVVDEVEHLDRGGLDDLDRPERGGEALQIHHRGRV